MSCVGGLDTKQDMKQENEQIADSDTELFSDIDYSNVSNARYLYDFDENLIAILYEFEPQGYAIYVFDRNTVLEYTKEADHQFYTDSDKRYYYNGILEFFILLS